MDSSEIDYHTTMQIFPMLRQHGHIQAALDVAEAYMKEQREIDQFLRDKGYVDRDGKLVENKIQVIKEVRAEFDLALSEAKNVVEEYQNERHK